MFFFFKQKTAYEMRISDWSSDVCSSDLDILAVNEYRCFRRVRCQRYGVEYRVTVRVNVEERRTDDKLIERGGTVTFDLPSRDTRFREIGRASCRERVCQYV